MKDNILLFVPFILCVTFLILTLFNKFNNIDRKIIKRVYYLTSITWIALFIKSVDIKIIEVFKNTNNTNSTYNINKILLALSLFAIVILWDYIFVSCRQVSKFSFKGVEITTEEFNEMKASITSEIEDYNCLQEIVKIQYSMFRNMNLYYNRMKELNGGIIYKRIINKYSRMRNDIKIDIFYYNEKDLELIQKKYKIDKAYFGSICYSLSKYGFCIPFILDDSEKDMMLAVITTSFTKDDLLIAISGNKILKYENLIIQNIISYFDRLIEVQGYKEKFD
jgi:hypothetical protein